MYSVCMYTTVPYIKLFATYMIIHKKHMYLIFKISKSDMGIPIQCGVPQCCIRQVACSVLRYGQETASYRRQTYQVLLLPQTQLYQAEILQLFHTLAPPEKKNF